MDHKEFIDSTIFAFDDDLFFEFKDFLLKQNFVSFHYFKDESLSKELVMEKLCDCFEKIEINTKKTFTKLIEKYISNLDSVVGDKIVKVSKTARKRQTVTEPRASMYYDKAKEKKNANSLENIIDYTRIMMCLYTSILNNDRKEINDLDYSLDCLNIAFISRSLEEENSHRGNSLRFNMSDPYGSDIFTFIMCTIVFYTMKNYEKIGGV